MGEETHAFICCVMVHVVYSVCVRLSGFANLTGNANALGRDTSMKTSRVSNSNVEV